MTRVLCVDDKEESLYYLQVLFGGSGFIVDVARNGAEALALARQVPPDLIVSDLLMPVMDGFTLLRHWKADPRLREVPFIVYTATYTDTEDERLASSLGADAFILKPAPPDELLARMDEVLAAPPAQPAVSVPDEGEELLKSYSGTLIRKLEEKTLQLEEKTLQLEETNESLGTLFESIPQIVWMTTVDSERLDFNQRWTEFTGLSLHEGVGRWIATVHPDDRADTVRRFQESSAAGEPFEIEFRLRRADGAHHWMLGRALPLRDGGGAIVRWFGTFTDIQELKKAQERMGAQARLLDLTQDAIVVQDLDHRVLYWNKGAERIHGWTAEEATGELISALHCPDVSQAATIVAILLERGEWRGDLRLVDRRGHTVLAEGRWTLVPSGEGEGQSVLAVNTDVTERKKIEAQFLRVQRLESIGTLASGIAHDLNNLLMPITMGTELLRLQATDPDTIELIEAMETSAQRSTDLVKRVLSFARGVDGERVEVRVDALVDEVVAFARATFPHDIVVRAEVADDVWPVIGDATQLNQVLLNLCVNARDAMPGGGHLVPRARNVAVSEALGAGSRRFEGGRYVALEVVDDGCGIPEDLLERIFEPFMTTKEPESGTGLGLSTVLGIVNSHHGFVDVDSRVGEGSRFTVYLPAAPAPASASASAS